MMKTKTCYYGYCLELDENEKITLPCILSMNDARKNAIVCNMKIDESCNVYMPELTFRELFNTLEWWLPEENRFDCDPMESILNCPDISMMPIDILMAWSKKLAWIDDQMHDLLSNHNLKINKIFVIDNDGNQHTYRVY